MESNKIGTNDLDVHLDRFLVPYNLDGRAVKYGHVIVKRMENSRPRDANRSPRIHPYPELPVTSYQATGRFRINGLYTLEKCSRLIPAGLMSWMQQLGAMSMPDIELEGFVTLLKNALPFGQQCLKIIMTTHSNPGLRFELGIKQNPVAAADAAFRAESNSKDFQSPWAQVNSVGSPIQVQTALASLTVTVYHHRGAPFNWIIIPPSQKLAFEQIIRGEFQQEIRNQECSQFVHHLSLFILPERLRLWGIEYFEVAQNAGNLLFIFPGAYFYGFSAGHNVIEWKYHAGKYWDCSSYQFCQSEHFLCGREHQGGTPLYVQAAREQGQASGSAGAGSPLLPALKRRKRSKKSDEPTFSVEYLPADADNAVGLTRPSVCNTPGEMHRPGEGQALDGHAGPTFCGPDTPDEQLAYLLSINGGLGQENQNLHQVNRDLAMKLQQSSTEREVDLRDRLQEMTTERDAYLSFLLDRDHRIGSLESQLSEIAVLKEKLHVAVAQRDILQSTQEKTHGYVKSLEAQAAGNVEDIPWRAAAMKVYWTVSERDKRIGKLEKRLRENNITVPERIVTGN